MHSKQAFASETQNTLRTGIHLWKDEKWMSRPCAVGVLDKHALKGAFLPPRGRPQMGSSLCEGLQEPDSANSLPLSE